MRRTRALIALAVALVALSIAIAACGGGDDEETNTRPAPAETPGDGATPPSPGALPPELLQCFADKGYKIESPAQIHSAPPQVVQECFEILHEGGGAP